jgi:hypothetical protein
MYDFVRWDGVSQLYTPDGKLHTAEEIAAEYPVLLSPYGICQIVGGTLQSISNLHSDLINRGVTPTDDADRNLQVLNDLRNQEREANSTTVIEPTVEEQAVALQQYQTIMAAATINEPDPLVRIADALENILVELQRRQ